MLFSGLAQHRVVFDHVGIELRCQAARQKSPDVWHNIISLLWRQNARLCESYNLSAPVLSALLS